jgi:hypothetical protein
MSYFRNQGLIEIILDVGIDITGATCYILFERPDGSHGSLEAEVYQTTKVRYVASDNTQFNQVGNWKFQAKITANSKDGYGEIVTHNFKKPLN